VDGLWGKKKILDERNVQGKFAYKKERIKGKRGGVVKYRGGGGTICQVKNEKGG